MINLFLVVLIVGAALIGVGFLLNRVRGPDGYKRRFAPSGMRQERTESRARESSDDGSTYLPFMAGSADGGGHHGHGADCGVGHGGDAGGCSEGGGGGGDGGGT